MSLYRIASIAGLLTAFAYGCQLPVGTPAAHGTQGPQGPQDGLIHLSVGTSGLAAHSVYDVFPRALTFTLSPAGAGVFQIPGDTSGKGHGPFTVPAAQMKTLLAAIMRPTPAPPSQRLACFDGPYHGWSVTYQNYLVTNENCDNSMPQDLLNELEAIYGGPLATAVDKVIPSPPPTPSPKPSPDHSATPAATASAPATPAASAASAASAATSPAGQG